MEAEKTKTPFDSIRDQHELELFDYHAPSDRQIHMLVKYRTYLKDIAKSIHAEIPASAERTLAIRALHKASMMVNSAIIFSPEPETEADDA